MVPQVLTLHKLALIWRPRYFKGIDLTLHIKNLSPICKRNSSTLTSITLLSHKKKMILKLSSKQLSITFKDYSLSMVHSQNEHLIICMLQVRDQKLITDYKLVKILKDFVRWIIPLRPSTTYKKKRKVSTCSPCLGPLWILISFIWYPITKVGKLSEKTKARSRPLPTLKPNIPNI